MSYDDVSKQKMDVSNQKTHKHSSKTVALQIHHIYAWQNGLLCVDSLSAVFTLHIILMDPSKLAGMPPAEACYNTVVCLQLLYVYVHWHWAILCCVHVAQIHRWGMLSVNESASNHCIAASLLWLVCIAH